MNRSCPGPPTSRISYYTIDRRVGVSLPSLSHRYYTDTLPILDHSADVCPSLDQYWRTASPPSDHNCAVCLTVFSVCSSRPAVLHQMNDTFRQCLQACQLLNQGNVVEKSGMDVFTCHLQADKLIYDHAIEMVRPHLTSVLHLFGLNSQCVCETVWDSEVPNVLIKRRCLPSVIGKCRRGFHELPNIRISVGLVNICLCLRGYFGQPGNQQ